MFTAHRDDVPVSYFTIAGTHQWNLAAQYHNLSTALNTGLIMIKVSGI
jgi:hypothetical protein